jgi:hypothetical protein
MLNRAANLQQKLKNSKADQETILNYTPYTKLISKKTGAHANGII